MRTYRIIETRLSTNRPPYALRKIDAESTPMDRRSEHAGDHAGADGPRVRAAIRHRRAVPGGVGEGAPGRGHAMPALWQPQKLRLRPPRWLHAVRQALV